MPLTIRLTAAILGICFSALAAPTDKSEKELRARIAEFYQLAVDHKFRQAEQFVAEDSRDYFYEMKKPDLKSFHLDKIDFSADGKTAIATLTNEADIFFPGAGPMRMPSKSTTHWKLEKGKWYVYFDKNVLDTPMGKMIGHSGPAPQSPLPPGMPADPGALQTTAIALANGVIQPDRTKISLDAAKPKPEVVNFRNALPGQVTVTLAAEVPGLKVEIAKATLSQGEVTPVTITPLEGKYPRPQTVAFLAAPLNQRIVIYIDWPDEN